ncbi:hypothetical protein AVEN_243101-1 [Araneus ventricosus]|uniref:Uncharacterized protein n=1 Tax=Araneus ventricosus TaxID=182803 RepID=A0A4Y2UF57_ARAVE|nr:hypothetical protein AVEN_243101-1 [Araneus ventricosus]
MKSPAFKHHMILPSVEKNVSEESSHYYGIKQTHLNLTMSHLQHRSRRILYLLQKNLELAPVEAGKSVRREEVSIAQYQGERGNNLICCIIPLTG